MTRYIYNTATTLDGFIATESDSLDWLLKQQFDDAGPGGFTTFMAGVGTQVMGATTYEWVREHDPAWQYPQSTFVFTHRDLTPAAENVTMVSGSPAEHREALEASAGEGDVWLVGGGDLVAAFAADGMLDEVVVAVAPVTLGSGRPLLGGALDLELVETARNNEFVTARYAVAGPLGTRTG